MTIPSNYYIFIDILILAVYLYSLIVSFKNGLLYGFLDLVYTGLCLAGAYFAAPVLASMFPIIELDSVYKMMNLEPIVNTVVYFIIVTLVLKLLGLIIMPLFKSVSKLPIIGSLNKVLGLVLGFINATVIVLALGVLLNTPLFKNGSDVKEGTLFKYVSTYSEKAVTYVSDNIPLDTFKDKIEDFDVEKAREAFREWLMKKENISE